MTLGPVVVEQNEYSLTDALGNYTVTRTFTQPTTRPTSTSSDHDYGDTTAPVLTIPADYTVECSDEVPMRTLLRPTTAATSRLSWWKNHSVEGSGWVSTPLPARFTVTDDAGNSTTASRPSLFDTTAPEFTFVPEDYTGVL